MIPQTVNHKRLSLVADRIPAPVWLFDFQIEV